jgi:hypothetical protein
VYISPWSNKRTRAHNNLDSKGRPEFFRSYTINSTTPEVQLEQCDVVITRTDGTIAFEQHGVQVITTWSNNATTILAQTYFRGALNTQEDETSLAQVIHRVVMAIAAC